MDSDFFSSINLQPFIHQFFNYEPDAFVFAKDTKFRFTMMNNCLLKRLGLKSESEVLGKTDYDFFDTKMADLFRIEDEEVFECKQPVMNRVWSVPNGRGGLDWYVSSKYTLFNYKNMLVGYIGIMRGTAKAATILEPYSKFSNVIEYIQKNYASNIEISRLAEMSNLSISQFERQFKKILELTPIKFINKVRMDNACELLLKTDQPLASIALECGFYDHSYFTRKFKIAYGVTPHQYRKQFLEKR
ncbi:MAG: AraC family transcriptional regulator [Lentisphaerales bacterium]|nr:AraC family transcriptional regulator [Lentisphaerales bacterium]